MREDVPTVAPDAPLHEVVQAVTSTRLNRAPVVDANRRVLRSLVHWLPFLWGNQEGREAQRHASARAAVELMNAEVFTAGPDTPLREVVGTMVEGSRKLVAVVDDQGRLLGVVDRADVLRGIVNQLA